LYLLIELNDYVNKMKTITIPCISKEQDVIICSGQFNGLKFFYNKNLNIYMLKKKKKKKNSLN